LLGTLFKQVSAAEKKVDIEQPRYWLEFPPHYVARYLSVDRFSPAELAQWVADHPNDAKPPMYGKGDPRKTPQPDPRLRRP
jgi:hypothetical protein